MPLVVYIDLIFLMNLLIDASLLLVTAWMRKQKVVLWRLALSAVVGAMYVVMMFLPELSFLYTFLVKFLFSVVMLWVAFGFGSLQNYLRNMGAFYIVNFAAAGGILGVHYLLQDSGEIWSGIWYSASGGLSFSLKIGVLFILVCFFAVLYGFKRVIDARQRQERIRSFLADLEVRVGDTAITCTGLIDTGNQLSDPLSRLPVTVMEAVLWEQVLPPSYRGKLADERADNLILQLTEAGDFPWPERLRLVPYRGINKGTQFMLALKPDEVMVRLDGKEYRSSRVLIGLDGGRLSTEGTYQAIVHPALVESTEAKESMDTISKTGT
ncbi:MULTISPECIES: sigma-E processing peptidase SpoIIGA [Paenibacillus]|jgi:stage II sporulation protein GA (sporulation sigma-E factor processing peptidase)|uniref:Stage II sporulation protein GA (Sporulation sigma-E factor processing peptidase) n=1 Tax=Paenibacillus barengoltzii J12 TaxID=935846 RepID=A0ABY1M1K4_9BACL|nr:MULTISPECIES: sigma-E processing peptidase SpoIIGA [Paenibacillus]MCT2195345.1 sigma-E processing peptidase SpoIIGA [Paenibacillus sp. p3-SID1389]MEC2344177.1 sigma-E processing peptidase SpoIIGA [Paenibacillus barengoltzii]SMF40990.1 stage II sporulation protein GA (sporulation sigma-E factor processing peptidase) [Paenibacillus barengoltzii J12]